MMFHFYKSIDLRAKILKVLSQSYNLVNHEVQSLKHTAYKPKTAAKHFSDKTNCRQVK